MAWWDTWATPSARSLERLTRRGHQSSLHTLARGPRDPLEPHGGDLPAPLVDREVHDDWRPLTREPHLRPPGPVPAHGLVHLARAARGRRVREELPRRRALELRVEELRGHLVVPAPHERRDL